MPDRIVGRSSGHSVLVVPAPELDAYVRGRTAFYDDSFVSVDPAFVHAHITLLGPWLSEPTESDIASVCAVLGMVEPFEILLRRIETFPDGLIHLRPEPDEPLRALTRALVRRFPGCPPYAGRFDDPVPHLTLDRRSDQVDVAGVAAALTETLPARVPVDRVDLQWWANHDCHVRHTWKLGGN